MFVWEKRDAELKWRFSYIFLTGEQSRPPSREKQLHFNRNKTAEFGTWVRGNFISVSLRLTLQGEAASQKFVSASRRGEVPGLGGTDPYAMNGPCAPWSRRSQQTN